MTDLPRTMRGVQLVGHGGPEQLVYREDIPVPQPGPTDVLIRVAAAGVNNTDINTRVGWYSKSDGDSRDAAWNGKSIRFPLIQGADVCGRVMAVGEQAEPSLLGRRVLVEPSLAEANGRVLDTPWYFGSECDGGFAQYTRVAARHAHAVESNLSDIELASFPCSYSTAENLLTRSGVAAGERVLITGASGGVGSAAVQLARARSARVVAVTSSVKAQRLQDLGAEQTLDRDASPIELLGRNSIDVVIDLVGGSHWPELLEVLRPFGRYAVSGAIAGPLVELDLRTLYLKDLSLFGCTVLDPQVFPNLVQRIEAGEISALVEQTFALTEIAQAQAEFEKKRHVGKLVIDISRH